jgi:hypothetical protein
VLVLDMIEILPPLGAAYETSISISGVIAGEEASIFYLSIDYTG